MHPSETLKFGNIVKQLRKDGFTTTETLYPFWFGDAPELNGKLNDLVLAETKLATASLLWTWEAFGLGIPEKDQLHVLLDWNNEPLGVIRNTKVEVVSFNKVSDTFAKLEGEGDLSLKWWKKVHWECFNIACDSIDKTATENMPVVCQEFQIVFVKST